MNRRFAFAVALSTQVVACSSSTAGILPTRVGAAPTPELTLVWVGEGKVERLEDGQWLRAETFDYEFTVEQRRFADHWESVKHLRRRHPAYDGSAGPREETMFFRLELGAGDASEVRLRIDSSLGSGEGSTDREFRAAELVMHPDISSFAPFDTYRIAQRYGYEEGVLRETVSRDKGDEHWVRSEETAALFAAHAFEAPPTRR